MTDAGAPTVLEVRDRERRGLRRRRNIVLGVVASLSVVGVAGNAIGGPIADRRAHHVAHRLSARIRALSAEEVFDAVSTGAFYQWDSGGRMATATGAAGAYFAFYVTANPDWLFWAPRCVVSTFRDEGDVVTVIRRRPCP